MRVKMNGTYVDESALPETAQADLRAIKRFGGIALAISIVGVLMIPTAVILGIAAIVALFTSGLLAAAKFAAFAVAAYAFMRGLNALIVSMRPSIAKRADSLKEHGVDIKSKQSTAG